jgi:hypothetical protein
MRRRRAATPRQPLPGHPRRLPGRLARLQRLLPAAPCPGAAGGAPRFASSWPAGQRATIAGRVAAISKAHQPAGVKAMLGGIRRTIGTAQASGAGASSGELRRMVATCGAAPWREGGKARSGAGRQQRRRLRRSVAVRHRRSPIDRPAAGPASRRGPFQTAPPPALACAEQPFAPCGPKAKAVPNPALGYVNGRWRTEA